ncbi:hypothetical protein MMC22_003393 [Lobaria immixta]|nr:hypothetical protein [Lobaria immixta]
MLGRRCGKADIAAWSAGVVRFVLSPSDSKMCNGCIPRGTECVDQEDSDVRPSVTDKRKEAGEKEPGGLISQVLQNMKENEGASSLGESEMTAAEALKRLQSELLPANSMTTAADVSANHDITLDSIMPENLVNVRGDAGVLWSRIVIARGGPHAFKQQFIFNLHPTLYPFFSLALFRSTNLNSSHSAIHRFEKAPLLSLFDNAVLNHDQNGFAQTGGLQMAGIGEHQPVIYKNSRVLKAVKVLVPNSQDLTPILKISQVWSLQWHKNFPDILGSRFESLEPSQIQSALEYIHRALESDKAADIVRILLCLALSLQQLPGDFGFAQMNLPALPEALQDYHLISVETLLASDEGFVCTCDDLAYMLLQAQFYIYTGKPRKPWLIFRRVVSFAHLLGLFRRPGIQAEEFPSQRRSLWSQIWQGERYLSLILGLPYATANSDEDLGNWEVDTTGFPGEHFLLRLGVILGHVIDRNQSLTNMDYPITVKIDQELKDSKRPMPPGWLEAVPPTGLRLDYIYDTTICKLMFNNARKLLHLPFMLKISTDTQYQFGRLAALESPRTLIEACQVLRNVGRPIVTKFTAGMITLIDLLGYTQYSSGHNTEQEKKDWEMVDELTQSFTRLSEQKPCSVATKAAGALEDAILTCAKTFMGLSFHILERFELVEEKHSHHGKSPYTRINSN